MEQAFYLAAAAIITYMGILKQGVFLSLENGKIKAGATMPGRRQESMKLHELETQEYLRQQYRLVYSDWTIARTEREKKLRLITLHGFITLLASCTGSSLRMSYSRNYHGDNSVKRAKRGFIR